MKKKKTAEIIVNGSVNPLQVEQLYEECIANYLDVLKDEHSQSVKLWKCTYWSHIELSLTDRIVFTTLESFNYESLIGCDASIDFTFFYPRDIAFELDITKGFIRLLNNHNPEKFTSMMGLLLELQMNIPFVSRLTKGYKGQDVQNKLKLTAENDFKDF